MKIEEFRALGNLDLEGKEVKIKYWVRLERMETIPGSDLKIPVEEARKLIERIAKVIMVATDGIVISVDEGARSSVIHVENIESIEIIG